MKKIIDTPATRLRKFRTEHGMTQAGLATKVGLEGYQIRDTESGKVEISTSFAGHLEHTLRCSSRWLLVREDPMMLPDTRLQADSAQHAMGASATVELTVLEELPVYSEAWLKALMEKLTKICKQGNTAERVQVIGLIEVFMQQIEAREKGTNNG